MIQVSLVLTGSNNNKGDAMAYFIYLDRSQKYDNLFVVSEEEKPKENPIFASDNKEELEATCNQLNDVLRLQMKTMLEEKDFFLKS